MRTEDEKTLKNETKKIYLEPFETQLEEALEENARKRLDEYLLYNEETASELKRSFHKETIAALKVEKEALEELLATIKKELKKVERY